MNDRSIYVHSKQVLECKILKNLDQSGELFLTVIMKDVMHEIKNDSK